MGKIHNDIFLINNDGLLEINKPEARNVPEFKAILIRDRGSDGDHDGRKKAFAFKELMFVYTYYHPLSMYRDLADEARFTSCISYASLPNNWKLDNLISAAGVALVEGLNLSSMFYTYVNANRAIYSLGQDIRFFNERKEKIRDRLKNKILQLDAEIEEEKKQELEREVSYLTDSLMGTTTKIMSINDSLPKAYETIEKLKQKLLDEELKEGTLYGGGTVGNREA